jgi:hypothetical protein
MLLLPLPGLKIITIYFKKILIPISLVSFKKQLQKGHSYNRQEDR